MGSKPEGVAIADVTRIEIANCRRQISRPSEKHEWKCPHHFAAVLHHIAVIMQREEMMSDWCMTPISISTPHAGKNVSVPIPTHNQEHTPKTSHISVPAKQFDNSTGRD
jgi:hypothetical protein